jgi:nucleotide-binding universal stress UspA family protein
MTESVIVFPTDFSSQSLAAVEWARKMAQLEQAIIHCIYAIEMPHYYGAFVNSAAMMPSASELEEFGRQRMSEFLAEHAGQFGQEPVTAVLVGKPSIQIIDYAREHEAKMIVMSTHGYRGLRHAMLGSTTEAVLREADCPVLVIRSTG